MCVPDGQIIVVGTPFHQQDLYADLEKNEQYHFQRYCAWDDQAQRALWPERYNAARLAVRRKEIGEVRFAREFMCNPVSDDASLFPQSLFRGEVEVPHVVLGLDWMFWEKLGVTQRFMGVDFAISTNVGADYTVLWVMGMDKFGNRWIIDIIRERGRSFQEQLSMIREAHARYRTGFIFLESNQMQRIFGEELIRTTDLPIKQCHTGENKHSLEKGMPSLRVLLENKKLRIPRGDDRSRELTDIWIDEMRSHTFQGGKVISVGEHDDTAMAFYICEQALRAGTFGFSFGEEAEDEEAYQEVMRGLPLPGVKPDSRPDDEIYDDFYDDDVDEDFVLGAVPQRGRPRRVNAQLADSYGIEDEDLPPRHRNGGKGESHRTRRPRLRTYEEVRPKLGSPMGAAFRGGFGGDTW
jgi:hypothetical protein